MDCTRSQASGTNIGSSHQNNCLNWLNFNIFPVDSCSFKIGNHRSLLSNVQMPKDQVFSCRLCKKTFSDEQKLVQHESVHRDKRYGKQYSCQTCGKLFSTPGYLETHQRLHSGEKPYTCPICGRKFAQRPGYTYHMRTHSGDKRYQCRICDKTFIQIGTIKRHCETHELQNGNVDDIIIKLDEHSKVRDFNFDG